MRAAITRTTVAIATAAVLGVSGTGSATAAPAEAPSRATVAASTPEDDGPYVEVQRQDGTTVGGETAKRLLAQTPVSKDQAGTDLYASYGLIAVTLYFNHAETASLAIGGALAERACSYIPNSFGKYACKTSLVLSTTYAGLLAAQGKCLKVTKFYTNSFMIPGSHSGSRC